MGRTAYTSKQKGLDFHINTNLKATCFCICLHLSFYLVPPQLWSIPPPRMSGGYRLPSCPSQAVQPPPLFSCVTLAWAVAWWPGLSCLALTLMLIFFQECQPCFTSVQNQALKQTWLPFTHLVSSILLVPTLVQACFSPYC